MTLNDPSTRLRFYILFAGILLLWLMPSGYGRDITFCAVVALLSIVTTVTVLATKSKRKFSWHKALWHTVASIYIGTIFLLTLLGILAANSYRPVLFLCVFIAIGIQAVLK